MPEESYEPKYHTGHGRELLGEIMPSEFSKRIEQLTPEQIDNTIDKALEELVYRDREVIKLRYGIEDGQTYTCREIGRRFAISGARARQLEVRGMDRLRRQELTDLFYNDAQRKERFLGREVSTLDLSVRARNRLGSEGIMTVQQLLEKTERDLMKIRNLGTATLREIKKKLGAYGLSLAQP